MPQVDVVIFYPQVVGLITLFVVFYTLLLRNSVPITLAILRSRFQTYLNNIQARENIYTNLQLKISLKILSDTPRLLSVTLR